MRYKVGIASTMKEFGSHVDFNEYAFRRIGLSISAQNLLKFDLLVLLQVSDCGHGITNLYIERRLGERA